MMKILHYNTNFILRYVHATYVEYLFKNIEKQQNKLKISLLYTLT